jgi:hypothetical protein
MTDNNDDIIFLGVFKRKTSISQEQFRPDKKIKNQSEQHREKQLLFVKLV